MSGSMWFSSPGKKSLPVSHDDLLQTLPCVHPVTSLPAFLAAGRQRRCLRHQLDAVHLERLVEPLEVEHATVTDEDAVHFLGQPITAMSRVASLLVQVVVLSA